MTFGLSLQACVPVNRASLLQEYLKPGTAVKQSQEYYNHAKKYPEHSFHKNFQKLVGTQLKK